MQPQQIAFRGPLVAAETLLIEKVHRFHRLLIFLLRNSELEFLPFVKRLPDQSPLWPVNVNQIGA